jgi:hypothetical protein
MWPWLGRDAPYSFWLVAIAVYFSSFLLGTFVAVSIGLEPPP